MAHEYSLMIHSFISERISIAEQRKAFAQKEGDTETSRYFDGQLVELRDIRTFLTEQVDLKTQRYY